MWKFLSMPLPLEEKSNNFPCPNFGACKRTQQLRFITGCWKNSYVQFLPSLLEVSRAAWCAVSLRWRKELFRSGAQNACLQGQGALP
jgi:hypothetical protein